jgi:hypothetical protein
MAALYTSYRKMWLDEKQINISLPRRRETVTFIVLFYRETVAFYLKLSEKPWLSFKKR